MIFLSGKVLSYEKSKRLLQHLRFSMATFYGGAGGAIIPLRKRFTEPPSRHSLYLSGERIMEIP